MLMGKTKKGGFPLGLFGKRIRKNGMPEGFIKVPIVINGKLQHAVALSPNSPLNWANGELAKAILKMVELRNHFE